MPYYFPDMNSYLHQSSLLLEAYPGSTRITTKYSLPQKLKSKREDEASATEKEAPSAIPENKKHIREQQPLAATLTFKTFETTAGICLKYQTVRAAEVGRLMMGLGRLAKGDIIEELKASVGGEGAENKTNEMVNINPPSQKTEQTLETVGGIGKARKKKIRK